ncbi:L-rhamnose mutarotase [Dactylosporangium sp. AC04546]|uniref:L-rhamnose mutarotase n=1 Tax=Dactylosporangium sp. AC04546 TaxID=2862460 RepID=UPI001EE12AA4|nr:L-rhamnose mutarotase [Dactylosporangium sp. AC04546]WVK89732.1 L-rhamnose mutarotase [Dactylosporangium sp. AC04546]
MQIVALYTRLRPGQELEYEKAHRVVPAEIADDLRARGVSEWRIFRRGVHLFHVVHVEDYRAFAAGPATNATAEGWGAVMEQFLEIQNDMDDPDRNLLGQVWALTENGQ